MCHDIIPKATVCFSMPLKVLNSEPKFRTSYTQYTSCVLMLHKTTELYDQDVETLLINHFVTKVIRCLSGHSNTNEPVY